MKLTERLNIRPACTDCPTMRQLAQMHDGLAEVTNNFIQACMRGEIDEGLLQSLIDSGMAKDEALDIIAERSDEIQAENVAAAAEMDETLDAHVSLAEKIHTNC